MKKLPLDLNSKMEHDLKVMMRPCAVDGIDTWRNMIGKEIESNKDTLIACTLSDAEMDRKFDAWNGMTNGTPFTAWGEKYVYFPVVYDGGEWCGSAPRHPCDIATKHIGDG